ncbi:MULTISPECIES: UTP--glucose-1-phosphate uridylyltransferase GalU [Priestia]|uniref:UTP--glucose-1-phosphate uridylyltransferase GalU n=1 Tax=Priestia TaxID=2800373 RepID=UPI000BF51C8D|nr:MULTISPECIES: UTP--glucose-1-phosphate uridylyltransferase GalU [Priestia]MBK0005881.1 UTP--glucose-1-phosphate uridylyltransferase GalU [Bacillus sp. S35]MCM3253981.1 UTP--glucose-1-phosphate uridylyltransferase GalU [Priestia aryabhattai]MCM3640255.1 UTP--glucose-1-phosphate uridylyltransferase GalU [Priestia aryabhattai]PFW76989.1 UTP--glucose-1-phosphate uridylyltransferase [Priestia aryabhattai]
MKTIKKAVIPAAGLGTRFLPVTKSIPKEMLPIVNKPVIQFIVEEALKSGIEDILIVTGNGKQAIENHFDHNIQLEHLLDQKGKTELLEEMEHISELANIHYVRQKEMKGLGHAINCARQFIGNEPFAVLLGDDLTDPDQPCLKQLIDQYNQTGSSVIGVQRVEEESVHRYGIIDPKANKNRLYEVNGFVEKPSVEEAPSNLGIIGRYVFTPDIFDYLETQEVGKGGEIQLTDAIQRMNIDRSIYAYEFEGERYDAGEKLDFIFTTLAFALKDEELKAPLLTKFKELINKEEQKEKIAVQIGK